MIKQPIKDEKNSYRVYRGGSWNNNARNTRVSIRLRSRASLRNRYLGFRIVRNKPKKEK